VPYIELDALYWMPAWVPRDSAEFAELVAERLDADGWVYDCNYSRVQPLVEVYRRRYSRLPDGAAHSNLRVIRLRSRRQAAALVRSAAV
jgi:hypothetical protein